MKLLLQNPIHYVLAPGWKYVPANKTDIRETFRKERERLAAQNIKLITVREFKQQ